MDGYPKISVNVLGTNEKPKLGPCLTDLSRQDYPNFEVTYIDNNSSDGSVEYVQNNFSHVKIIQKEKNEHYAPAHNLGVAKTDGEYICILNSDIQLEPNFLSELIKPMLADDKIAGVQGKLLRPDPVDGKYIFDGTGLTIDRNRTVRDRYQLQVDEGQYNEPGEVFAINGSSPLYRRAALMDVAIDGEVLDEDMQAYFDDSDLGWRIRHFGWKLWYQPTAIAYHERLVGQSSGGWKKFASFVKHRRSISVRNKKYAFKNHIFLIMKNDFDYPLRRDLPRILFRELAMFGYTLIFDIKVLAVLP
ncbi:MAG TPA: glycosyltransferase family 2 protein, partial [Flavobacterium sp.]|nr:glycosyltransferase family 2 protein [Flavobacterium sp.]